MYEHFYGLQDKPFNLSPDPRFFFESRGHARALAYLQYGVEQGEGFVVVTGDVGTGKTTLARMLHDEVVGAGGVIVVQLVMTHCSGNQLLRIIAESLGLAHQGRSKASVLSAIAKFLQEQHDVGKRTLLLLDEVQNLPMEALEVLRMLSNYQSGGKPLVQSLLLGQAEFQDTLNRPNLEQFRQRVIASCHLSPLGSAEETRAYVEHRLRHVGWSGDPRIDEAAFETVQSFTRGVPRRINTFCDRLLLFAFLEGLHEITLDTVEAVAEEISGDFPVEQRRARQRAASPDGAGDADAGDARIAELEERVRVLEQAVRSARDGIDLALQRPGVSSGQGR